MIAYYINLDRSEDRREKMEISFENESLIRISAIDGMEWAIENEFDNRGFPVWDMLSREKFINDGILFDSSILPPTHVACNLSHRKAIQEFLNTEDEWAIIMEDDVEPSGKLLREGGIIVDHLVIPDEADIFYLCGIRPDRRVSLFEDGQIRKVRTLMGYCISRKAAELFLRSTVPMMWLSDHQFPLCCFNGLSDTIGKGKTRNRKIIFKEKVLYREVKDKEGNIRRKQKTNISFEIPDRNKTELIGSVLPEGIESEEKIKAFADNGYGLIKHSMLAKQSLLSHSDKHGNMMAEDCRKKRFAWI